MCVQLFFYKCKFIFTPKQKIITFQFKLLVQIFKEAATPSAVENPDGGYSFNVFLFIGGHLI
jgi:hypothetical protein